MTQTATALEYYQSTPLVSTHCGILIAGALIIMFPDKLRDKLMCPPLLPSLTLLTTCILAKKRFVYVMMFVM